MKKSFLIVLILACAFSPVRADTYIKSLAHTDAIVLMGQTQKPASDDAIEQWFGKDKMAMHSAKISVIVDLSKNSAQIINHVDKTYAETGYPVDMSKVLDAQTLAALKSMGMTFKVTPTDQKQKIGQWNCTGYDMEVAVMGMNFKSRIWATGEAQVDSKLYGDLNMIQSSLQMIDQASMAELKKIKGVQIASEMTMEIMGAKFSTSNKVLEIGIRTPAATIYAVPAGYAKKATIDMSKLN